MSAGVGPRHSVFGTEQRRPSKASFFLAPIGLVSELRTNLSQSAFKNDGSKYDEQGEGEKVQHRNMQEQEEYNKRPRNTRKVGIEERW